MFTIDHGQNIFAWYKSLHTRSKSFRSHFRRFNATILDRCFFFKNMRSTFEDIWLKTYHINPRFAALALKAFPADSRSSQSVSDDSQPPRSRGYLAVRSFPGSPGWRENEWTFIPFEWSLRAFASMRAVRLFLRARAVINFIMRAASTLEITNMASSELFVYVPPAGISFY